MNPEIIRIGILDLQICVPKDWTDQQVMEYVNSQVEGQWHIRTDPALLDGDPVRNPCIERPDFVHITLDY